MEYKIAATEFLLGLFRHLSSLKDIPNQFGITYCFYLLLQYVKCRLEINTAYENFIFEYFYLLLIFGL